MSIFSTLNTGVSGMNAAQTQISTTGHNITNANNQHYTRQRVVQQAADPMYTRAGNVGLGTRVKTIIRIHDEFVYNKLRQNTTKFEESTYLKTKLEEAAQRFPDLKDVGILNDLQAYQKAWNDYASNPADSAMKINLVQTATTFTRSIQASRESLFKMQKTINDDLELTVTEINRIGEEIAKINARIVDVESSSQNPANDLRDQRDELELRLSKLVSASVFKNDIAQNVSQDMPTKDSGADYYLNIEGFSLVDGSTFHPLKTSAVTNGSAFSKIYYEMQDGSRAELSNRVSGGQLGAILQLRGRFYNEEKEGFNDGIMQEYIDDLDALAKTVIVSTNNIYSKAASENVHSKPMPMKGSDTILNVDDSLKIGTFDLVVYDNNGNEVTRKTIELNPGMSMLGDARSGSLIEQINSNTDDNNDNDPLNDFDDYFQANYSYDEHTKSGTFSLIPKKQGYKVGIEDNGTNFPGVFGTGQFFEGSSAKDINVDTNLRHDPSKLRASSSGADGNNDVANEMTQLQYTQVEFGSSINPRKNTFEGFYREITTNIASRAQNNNTLHNTNQVILENVTAEFQSISGVDINEELSNLMKFQASFGASAKIISTVDKMLDTLLGLKQ